MSSSRVPLSALRPRLSTSPHGSRGNLNDRAGGHRSVRAESDNCFGDNLTDELRPFFVRHRAGPFFIVPFHASEIANERAIRR